MKKLLIIIAILSIFSCSKKEQPRINTEQVNRGTEVFKTYISLAVSDTVAAHTDAQLLDSALKVNNMSREEFDRVLAYFKKNPNRFNEELTGLTEFIDQLKVE